MLASKLERRGNEMGMWKLGTARTEESCMIDMHRYPESSKQANSSFLCQLLLAEVQIIYDCSTHIWTDTGRKGRNA